MLQHVEQFYYGRSYILFYYFMPKLVLYAVNRYFEYRYIILFKLISGVQGRGRILFQNRKWSARSWHWMQTSFFFSGSGVGCEYILRMGVGEDVCTSTLSRT